MKNYKLSLEINLDGENPLDVAKKLAEMLMDNANEYQYYVQDEETNNVYSVDLSEDEECSVLPVYDYQPFIN